MVNLANDDEGPDDVAAITPTTSVRVAGGATMLSGALCLVVALQAVVLLQVRGLFQLFVVLFVLLGAGGLINGYRLGRMRGGAALASAGIAGGIGVGMLVWFVVALLGGVFVLLALPILPVAGIAVITALSSRRVTAAADAARSRLRAQGLDAGL